VQLVVWDEGGPGEERIAGVRVIKTCREADGLRGVRFFHPRWTALNRALAAADADLYYHNCGEYVTGQVAWWCRRHRRRFVFSVASDPECDPALPLMDTRERLLFRYGLRQADSIIVQTVRQQRMLREGTGLESSVLPMPCPGPRDPFASVSPWQSDPLRVVWIGRVSSEKRLGLLAEVASALPHVRFDVVGPIAGADRQAVDDYRHASAQPNIVLRGGIPRDELASVYRGAAALVCTSRYEGFPNTFLEAWSYGVPVVSTVDPDGLLESRGLGHMANDREGLAARIQELTESETRWRACSDRVRSFYLARHTLDQALPRFEAVFLEVLRANEGRA
jgi:glycosyltransferase involved in cell wall biosynthesis